MSIYKGVEQAPPDAIFLVKQQYEQDQSKDKIDVGVGAYRHHDGKPFVLKVVNRAETILLEQMSNSTANHEYLPISGDKDFVKHSREFAFGLGAQGVKEDRIATIQSLSGTGALRIGMDFIAQTFDSPEVLISSPTWGNHFDIATRSNLRYSTYRYWNPATKSLDLDGMLEDIEKANSGSVILLHMCAHNPTGVDPSKADWKKILEMCLKKNLIVFFDAAYQGFASGNVDEDAFALRLFESAGVELLLAQSYSKNLGLYGQRVGALSIVCADNQRANAVESQLNKIVRAMYSNPPKHGAAVTGMILKTSELRSQWMSELNEMTDRIKSMRKGLRHELEKICNEQDWSYITDQIGMFTYTGLNKSQVEILQKKYHIYMPKTGRISMAGLTSDKLAYFAAAIKDVL